MRIRHQFSERCPINNESVRKKIHEKLKSLSILIKEILLKFIRNKKIFSEIMPQKNPTMTVKLGTIFEKSRRRRLVLKINGATPQLDQNLKPTRYLCGQLLYIYLCIYVFSV